MHARIWGLLTPCSVFISCVLKNWLILTLTTAKWTFAPWILLFFVLFFLFAIIRARAAASQKLLGELEHAILVEQLERRGRAPILRRRGRGAVAAFYPEVHLSQEQET